MRINKKQQCFLLATLSLALTLVAPGQRAAAAEPVRFRVSLAPGLAAPPVSGRLLLFMTKQTGPVDVIEPDFFNPESVWVAGAEVQDMEPGKIVEVDADALAFPAPFSTAPAGDYQVMALLDLNHSYTYSGMGPGDLYSAVSMVRSLTPPSATPIDLTLAKRVPDTPLNDTDSIKLVTFKSPSLGAFWGRPIEMRAGVVLPPSYNRSPAQRYPVVYDVHGFGGSHATAWQRGPELVRRMAEGATPEMVYVYLDGSWPMGHHEFADSVNNGPWGHALARELIPYLERRFRTDGVPAGRLLTGHSSGGWSTLWLQINYPEVFGGTWSTSPDPVDFRNFTGPDLTKRPPQNFYRRPDGSPYNLVRSHGREIMTLEQFARQERVLGYYGGQMASFEAVFSPRRDDGQPMPLFDRDTGRIDPFVQKAWERYDISRILRNHWGRLGPRLRGKIHIIVGTMDTFHLEAAVYLLRDTLKGLGSDATFEFLEGRDHFDLYEGGMADRIAREMYAVARPRGKATRRRRARTGRPDLKHPGTLLTKLHTGPHGRIKSSPLASPMANRPTASYVQRCTAEASSYQGSPVSWRGIFHTPRPLYPSSLPRCKARPI